VFMEEGNNLPEDPDPDQDLKGHEHFGFLDGVSQPGIRGRLSDAPDDFLTRRQNPDDPDQGKPGQDLLWPGEFVFGYRGQDPTKEVPQPGDIAVAGPAWAKDGSFLVFRRLRQDVAGFHAFLQNASSRLGIPVGRLGAKCVGRWESGAPILRASLEDNLVLAGDDCANNHFEFEKASTAIVARQDPDDCLDTLEPQSPGDIQGAICPLAGHIRKAYPRDDKRDDQYAQTPTNESRTQTHRLLRRGIPFGDPLNEKPDAPLHDSGNRGLLFMAYQTSIEEQFEFVTRNWVNNPNFLQDGSGHDPILGQNAVEGANRRRKFKFQDPSVNGGQPEEIDLEQDWVTPTGGGYFFAPSLSALHGLATKTLPRG
jgi:Dyp-type peroxidase family